MNISDINEKRIVIEFRLTRNKFLVMLTALFVMWFPKILGSETLELTTYYPAPYGGYARLLTTDLTALATNSSANVGIGTTSPASKLSVSGGVSVGSAYASLAAPSNGLIVQGNIGIGTNNPTEKLVVNGGNAIIGGGTIPASDGNGWLKAFGLQGMCEIKHYTENTSGSPPNNLTTRCSPGYVSLGYTNVTSISVKHYVFLTPTGEQQGLRFVNNVAGDMLCCKIKP